MKLGAWAHTQLLHFLPVTLLSTYIQILRYLKHVVQLTDCYDIYYTFILGTIVG